MMRSHDDRFFRVPTKTHHTSEGPVELPIRYYDVSVAVAVCDAELAGAQRLLEGTGLEPAMVVKNRAMVALAFYEYRDTSVGPYNEVGAAIFAKPVGAPRPRLGWLDSYMPPSRRTVGAWVVDLPVTTPIANAAGRELWGYPKFVTEIGFTLRGRDLETHVADPAGVGTIVRLSGRLGRSIPAPPLSLVTFTTHEGGLFRTQVDVRGAMRAHAPGSVRLETGPSEHPMAEHLRTLGLRSVRPRVVLTTDAFQSLLWSGERAR
jgi:hypothetical protein